VRGTVDDEDDDEDDEKFHINYLQISSITALLEPMPRTPRFLGKKLVASGDSL